MLIKTIQYFPVRNTEGTSVTPGVASLWDILIFVAVIVVMLLEGTRYRGDCTGGVQGGPASLAVVGISQIYPVDPPSTQSTTYYFWLLVTTGKYERGR